MFGEMIAAAPSFLAHFVGVAYWGCGTSHKKSLYQVLHSFSKNMETLNVR